jgi:hypothetical protein
LCGFSGYFEDLCLKFGNRVCQLSCNECQEVTEYFCKGAESVDACVASGEQICEKGKGNENGVGNLSCSQCQTLVEETCKYHRSEFKRKCVSGRKLYCHMSCNKCKEFTDLLCIFWSPRQLYYLADSAKTCIAKAEQYCLNTIDKSKGNSKSNGEGKSDENSKSNASSKSNEEGKGDEMSNVNSKSNNDDLQRDEKSKGNEYHNGK